MTVRRLAAAALAVPLLSLALLAVVAQPTSAAIVDSVDPEDSLITCLDSSLPCGGGSNVEFTGSGDYMGDRPSKVRKPCKYEIIASSAAPSGKDVKMVSPSDPKLCSGTSPVSAGRAIAGYVWRDVRGETRCEIGQFALINVITDPLPILPDQGWCVKANDDVIFGPVQF